MLSTWCNCLFMSRCSLLGCKLLKERDHVLLIFVITLLSDSGQYFVHWVLNLTQSHANFIRFLVLLNHFIHLSHSLKWLFYNQFSSKFPGQLSHRYSLACFLTTLHFPGPFRTLIIPSFPYTDACFSFHPPSSTIASSSFLSFYVPSLAPLYFSGLIYS